jgi:hypothetical protein
MSRFPLSTGSAMGTPVVARQDACGLVDEARSFARKAGDAGDRFRNWSAPESTTATATRRSRDLSAAGDRVAGRRSSARPELGALARAGASAGDSGGRTLAARACLRRLDARPPDIQVLYATTDLTASQAVDARGGLRLLTAAALTDLGWTRLD